jgi:hypothetical protein
MSLSMPPNVEFVVLRIGSPPSAVRPGRLEPAYEAGATGVEHLRYTHVLFADPSVDVRDAFNDFGLPGTPDQVAVPDASGTAWDVVFVDRPRPDSPHDVVRVLLCRRLPPYPTRDL